MGRRALQLNGASPSHGTVAATPSPTRLRSAGEDAMRAATAVGTVAAARPCELDVGRQRRRCNDIVVESCRSVLTVVKDDGSADDERRYRGFDDSGDEVTRDRDRYGAADRVDGGGGRLDDTLYELQRLLSNGKLPQRFLEKLVTDDDITDRLLNEFEKLTAATTESACRRPALPADRRPPAALQHHGNRGPIAAAASSSSSTPEMSTAATGRRSVRFDGTASDPPTTSARTRRRRNARSRSGSRGRPSPRPSHSRPLPEAVADDDDSHSCCSTCSSSSGSDFDDLSVYRLPARRPYGPGAGAAARISYVPNDAIAYAKQQAGGHRSPGRRSAAAATSQTSVTAAAAVDDKNCAIQ